MNKSDEKVKLTIKKKKEAVIPQDIADFCPVIFELWRMCILPVPATAAQLDAH